MTGYSLAVVQKYKCRIFYFDKRGRKKKNPIATFSLLYRIRMTMQQSSVDRLSGGVNWSY